MGEDKKLILVVDDEPDVRAYISTVLEDNGYETVTAVDGKDATGKVRERLPDLITLDITMPERSGVRFYRDMREDEAHSRIPIIIITGVSEDFRKFISTRKQVPPPQGYIPKPPSEEQLLALVRRLL